MSRLGPFVKLTTTDEVHRGLCMQDGLVVDPMPWDPCRHIGGIHFCRPVYIPYWAKRLHDMSWVREVTLPDDAEFVEFGEKAKASRVILGPRKSLRDYLSTWTEAMCLAAVQQDGIGIEFLSDEQRTPAVCLAAVLQNIAAIFPMTAKQRTEPVCVAAVQRDCDALYALSDGQRTEPVCLAAVQRDCDALYALSDGQRTEPVCLAAVQQNGQVIERLTAKQRTPAVCLAAVQQDAYAIYHMTAKQRTEAVCLAAKHRTEAFRFAN